MEPKRKLQQRTQEESQHEQQLGTQRSAREFASVEELLRHDAAQTSVPPAVAARLQESISREPSPNTSWWRRLFGS